MTGELEALSLYAGQSAGLIGGVKPAAAIVNDLVADAENVLRRLGADPGT
jgi:hypothetical protein